MSKVFAQVDTGFVKATQTMVTNEPRQDRQRLAVHGLYVAVILDELVPKWRSQCHSPSTREQELVTTWQALAARTRWPGSITSLRAALDRMFPHYMALPMHDGDRHTGIRILRLDSARQGLLWDIGGKQPTLDAAKRLARAEAYLMEIMRCIDRQDRTKSVRDLEGPVEQLYYLRRDGDDAVHDSDGLWEDDSDAPLYTVDQVSTYLSSRFRAIRRRE